MSGRGEVYTALSGCLREHFGMRVWRVAVSRHKECPNRMGGREGCIFCLPAAYEPAAALTAGSVREQLERGIARYRARGVAEGFVAYLQSGSNTYGSVEELRAVYLEALAVRGVVALSIATRPDCLPADVLSMLDELSGAYHIWVELGIQSMHERTLKALDRGHSAECSAQAIRALMGTRVQHIVAHMILGLPGETIEDMHASMREVCMLRKERGEGAFPRLGLKLHHLQVMRGTRLEAAWRAGEVEVMDLDEYARVVVEVLERVPRDVVIHRLCGEAAREYLCAPIWPGDRLAHVARIRDEFRVRGTWQGRLSVE